MYLPLHDADEKKFLISVPFKKLYVFTAAMPLLGFFTCFLLTMYKDFERANHTHCNVPNVFPSISAAIGNYSPQVHIWQWAIYIHSPGRFLTVYLRLKYYENVIKDNMRLMVYAVVVLNTIENICLLGLTYWTSLDYYPYHEKFFKTFIGSSIFYMLIVCVLLTYYRRRGDASAPEKRSLALKWRLFMVNAGSFACAAYFFLRHNKHCEPYMYSLFGFAEYVVVISNIAFHMTTIYDFHRKSIVITRRGDFLLH